MIRLRSSRALGGGLAPIAFSTARTEAMACTVVQTPQMRWAKAQASRGIAALEDDLDAAEHRGRRPGVLDLAAVDLGLDAQVPLDAGDGIDDDVSHGRLPSASASSGGSGSGVVRPCDFHRFAI